jgi:catechol 2,3-dioxygenase-like lactoylglutathione lyase family enzyme
MTERPPFKIGNLGEIAIRCRDYIAMTTFYRDIIGLEFMAERIPCITFFRIAAGYAGHIQVLALFAHNVRRAGEVVIPPTAGEGSTLHHLALAISIEDQPAAQEWLTAHGHATWIEDFSWIGWRGLFTTDPDGNTVEFVAKVHP